MNLNIQLMNLNIERKVWQLTWEPPRDCFTRKTLWNNANDSDVVWGILEVENVGNGNGQNANSQGSKSTDVHKPPAHGITVDIVSMHQILIKESISGKYQVTYSLVSCNGPLCSSPHVWIQFSCSACVWVLTQIKLSHEQNIAQDESYLGHYWAKPTRSPQHSLILTPRHHARKILLNFWYERFTDAIQLQNSFITIWNTFSDDTARQDC